MVLDKYKEVAMQEFKFVHSLIPKNVHKVYSIACRYYGEDRVQLDVGWDSYNPSILRNALSWTNVDNLLPTEEQVEFPEMRTRDNFWSMYGILIYFPEVTVSNESNQSTVIRDFFARVPLNPNGTIANGFAFNKATYTDKEVIAGYMHSHCHIIDRRHPEYWQMPCLGTGPIRNTLSMLIQSFDEQRYGLFFWELDKVTQVESLAGVPYIKMQSIGISDRREYKVSDYSSNMQLPVEHRETLKQFIKSYLSTDLFQLTILNGQVIIKESFIEWLVKISKYYMKWRIVAESLSNNTLDMYLTDYMIKDNSLFTEAIRESWNAACGTLIVKFKGREFKFNVINSNEETPNIKLFNVNFAHFILNQLLIYINCCYYGKNTKYAPERIGLNPTGKFIGITL